MTATYTTDLAKVAPYKRIVIRNIVHICALFILIAMVAGARGNFSPPGLISMAVGGLVGALALWLMTWSSLRTLDRHAATFQLTMDDETISVEAAGGPTVTLRFDEITAIKESPGSDRLLLTDDQALYIPELVGEFPALRS